MIASIDLFEILKARLGEAEAKMLVKEIEKVENGVEPKIEKAFEVRKDILATKVDIANLEIKIERGFNNTTKWLIATIIASTGLIIALMKMH